MRLIRRLGLKMLLVAFTSMASVKAMATDDIFHEYTVENLDDPTMQQVAEQFEILRREGSRYVVLVAAAQRSAFLKLAPQAQLIPDTRIQTPISDREYFAGYRSFTALEDLLKKIAQDHPEIARLETYGHSSAGKPLYVLKLSDNASLDEADEPRLLLDAATHGDEIITTEVLLRLIEELVAGYGTNERLTRMLNKTALYFVPVVNPDGFVKHQRYADGVDPNRQFPYPGVSYRKPIGIIQAVMDLVAKHRFQGSIDFHAHGEMAMYPWGYTYDPIANTSHRQEFAALTDRMTEINGYTAGPISEVIYVAKGSSADFYYWQHQTRALAVEMGRSKAPPGSLIPDIADDVFEMTWRFIEHFAP